MGLGDIPSNLQSAAQVAAEQLGLDTSVSGPVWAVHAALVQASCDGAPPWRRQVTRCPVCATRVRCCPRGSTTSRASTPRAASRSASRARDHQEVPAAFGEEGPAAGHGVGATDSGRGDRDVPARGRALLNAGLQGGRPRGRAGIAAVILTGTSMSTVVASAPPRSRGPTSTICLRPAGVPYGVGAR